MYPVIKKDNYIQLHILMERLFILEFYVLLLTLLRDISYDNDVKPLL